MPPGVMILELEGLFCTLPYVAMNVDLGEITFLWKSKRSEKNSTQCCMPELATISFDVRVNL